MSIKEEISKAIGAHGLWKQRLRTAIDTGKSEFTVAKVQPDNVCDFGKWLHSLPVVDKSSVHWKKIQPLHADFHREAARVLELALAGHKAEAEKGVSLSSKFAKVSAELTGAMIAWEKAVSQ